MDKRFRNWAKSSLKFLVVIGLVLTLVVSQADAAWAARSGGRIGGGSFRAPSSRTYAPRPQTRTPGGYGGGYGRGYGGGFGFPFLLPFFGFGGGFGGLLSIFVVIAISNVLVRGFQSVTSGNDSETLGSGKVSVAKLQVGLLAQARNLQTDLNRMADTADTGSAAGRAQVLQEATLALLRHPEYWVYGTVQVETQGMDTAEAQFNRWALAERSKFTAETLYNVNNQKLAPVPSREIVPVDTDQPINEYIVVTLVVGALGSLPLPKITNLDELRQVLSRLGSLSGEQLLAVEILWTPQADGDTLDADDLVTSYPELRLL
ncbi:MAG: DUF1517 domain-containing protein [Oscillatoriales cyanobacterium RM2_1_1]|nr:DUF1517 domain-containing protein [Oscillatoriales cyanobacterium RM2_1_1]